MIFFNWRVLKPISVPPGASTGPHGIYFEVLYFVVSIILYVAIDALRPTGGTATAQGLYHAIPRLAHVVNTIDCRAL